MRVPSFHHASWVSEYFTSPVALASPPQNGHPNKALVATEGVCVVVSILAKGFLLFLNPLFADFGHLGGFLFGGHF